MTKKVNYARIMRIMRIMRLMTYSAIILRLRNVMCYAPTLEKCERKFSKHEFRNYA